MHKCHPLQGSLGYRPSFAHGMWSSSSGTGSLQNAGSRLKLRWACWLLLQDMNVYELIRGRRHYVAEERVRSYLYQLMKSMDHMHRNGIFHRY
jgi:serine/threonine protein kinase